MTVNQNPHDRACEVIARCFNLLDPKPLREILAEDATYSTQSVFDTLRGKESIIDHFEGKFAAVRRNVAQMRGFAELGECSHSTVSGPVVILHQRKSQFGRQGLGRIQGFLTIKLNGDGKVSSLFGVTHVPAPESASGTGIFPGLGEDELSKEVDFEGEKLACTDNFQIYVIYNEEMGPDVRYARMLESACAEFGVRDHLVLVPKQFPKTCPEEVVTELSLVRLPAVVMWFDGELPLVEGGYLPREDIVWKLQTIIAVSGDSD